LLEALRLLADGKAPRLPQDHAQATFAPSLKKEQCRLNWGKSAAGIVNQIRGLSPWPVAETQWKDLTLRVFSGQVMEEVGSNAQPGEILKVSKDGIEVFAGEGRLLLKEIQPPGKKRMSAHDFTLGHPAMKAGERLI
jgi:methionyl-tRNA formyltransferase